MTCPIMPGQTLDREKYRLLDREFIDRLEDLHDDSFEFLKEELQRYGISSSKLAPAVRRLNYGLLSVWVSDLIETDSDVQMIVFRRLRNRQLLEEFFRKRFERPLPSSAMF
jgi:hypothetical protein